MKRHLVWVSLSRTNLALAALTAIGAVAIAYGTAAVLAEPARLPVMAAVEDPAPLQDQLTQAGHMLAADVSADTPRLTVNYQGLLRNPEGQLVTGTYTMTFRVYEQAAGGTEIYTSSPHAVSVADGVFNVVLGGDDDPPIAESLANPERYIGITLDDTQYEIQPRQRVHMVPWAIQSVTAQTLVEDAAIHGLTSDGDVTVTGDLAVSGSLRAGAYQSASGKTIKPIYGYYKVVANSGLPGGTMEYAQNVSCSEPGDEAISGAWLAASGVFPPIQATMGASYQLTDSSWYFRMDRLAADTRSLPYRLEVLCVDHTP